MVPFVDPVEVVRVRCVSLFLAVVERLDFANELQALKVSVAVLAEVDPEVQQAVPSPVLVQELEQGLVL